LKGFVQNKIRPTGNMAEVYAPDEALGFYTEYIQGFTTTRRRVWDDKDDPNMITKMLEGNGRLQIVIANLRNMAHSFVLQNVELMTLWHKYYFCATHFYFYYNVYLFIVGSITSPCRYEIQQVFVSRCDSRERGWKVVLQKDLHGR
jgi:hypothetical protein